MIMAAGGAELFGELRHHYATSQDALYIVGSGSRRNMSVTGGRARVMELGFTSKGRPGRGD
jgi:hypothetical protein